jgi:hypothetical protein
MMTYLSLVNEYVNPLSYQPDFEMRDVQRIEGINQYLDNLFEIKILFHWGGGRKLFFDTYQDAYNLYSTFLK